MPSASATRLYIEGSDVRCGERRGRDKCGRVVLRDGKVVDRGGHEFTLAELLLAAERARQVSRLDVLRETFKLEAAQRCDLAPYRQIEGLVVVGLAEVERAFLGPKGKNPLNLPAGWCEAIAPPLQFTPETMARVAEYCRTDDWQCAPALVFELHEVAGKPTSLLQMQEWFGYSHDGYSPGTIQQDIHYSNWYCAEQYRKQKWATAPIVPCPRWAVRYLPHPKWATLKTYAAQLEAVERFPGLRTAEAAGEAWMMDILTANDQRYRQSTWTCTATKVDGWPLDVGLIDGGVRVCQHCYPECVCGRVGLAVEGVWELAA